MSPLPDITDEEMSSLTQGLLTRYGLDFTCYEPKSLKRRFIRAMAIFDIPTAHNLWIRFLREQDFIQLFKNEISVGMTSMFRDPVVWKNISGRVATEYKKKDCINIWHAGCSTGEEVYSMSIVLKEKRMNDRVKALATDFNTAAIDKAQNGIYHKIKMVENESNYKAFNPIKDFHDYYTNDGNHATMNPELIQHATFGNHNLVTDEYSNGFDMIFCRNVMIYFDTVAKTKMLTKFYDSLNPGGYLVIGFFDTIHQLMMDHGKFNLVDEEAKIFQKV